MLNISIDQRRALRARAHALKPVVSISQNGLTEAVLAEIANSLTAHELIKIRVYNDERAVREQFLATICDQLEAAPVQHIGKLLIVWRSSPELQAKLAAQQTRRPRKEARRTKRSFQGGV